MTGRFIVFEGPDASGKTTQAKRLADNLGARFTREPGGTRIGDEVRRLLLDPTYSEMSMRAEALLYAAGRAQHVEEVIRPTLESGQDVVCDRFIASSLAYQGVGRGFDVDEILGLSLFATGGLSPDLTVLVDVPPAVSLERLSGDHDRIEAAGAELFEKVSQAYASFATKDPATWVVVDGDGTIEEVARRVDEAVAERL